MQNCPPSLKLGINPLSILLYDYLDYSSARLSNRRHLPVDSSVGRAEDCRVNSCTDALKSLGRWFKSGSTERCEHFSIQTFFLIEYSQHAKLSTFIKTWNKSIVNILAFYFI